MQYPPGKKREAGGRRPGRMRRALKSVLDAQKYSVYNDKQEHTAGALPMLGHRAGCGRHTQGRDFKIRQNPENGA